MHYWQAKCIKLCKKGLPIYILAYLTNFVIKTQLATLAIIIYMLIDIMLLGHLWYNKQANICSKSNNWIPGTTKTWRGGTQILAYL